jgi:hypothetical protein
MGSSQQQQQTNLKPIAPKKFDGQPTASMLKGLYGSKGPKTFGLIKGAKGIMKGAKIGAKVGSAFGKMPMKTKMKTTTPSRAMVEKSIRKTMGKY